MKEFRVAAGVLERMHLMEKFNTGAIVNLEIESQIGGYVVLNGNVKIDNSVFEGKYFERSA